MYDPRSLLQRQGEVEEVSRLMKLCQQIWEVPKIRGTILGIPLIRTIVFWGLNWGTPILGNYHIMMILPPPGTTALFFLKFTVVMLLAPMPATAMTTTTTTAAATATTRVWGFKGLGSRST